MKQFEGKMQDLRHKIDYTNESIGNKEGVLTNKGVLCIATGKRTGRSPKARFIVQDVNTAETVDWGLINQPMSSEKFAQLWQNAQEFDRNLYQQSLQLGHDPKYAININASTELAAHALFLENMFLVGDSIANRPTWELLSIASLTINPQEAGLTEDGLVAINFTSKQVLICGMQYCGEMKKAMFSVLNYILPAEGVLPMHCAASADINGNSALYFGLSGTGKTTLSADPDRFLLGDDEHGWSDAGIFNFEGGCYAKCINLSEANEPVIYQAIKPGALLENVVLDSQQKPDYDDVSKTKNTRVSYPLNFIPQRVEPAVAKHPDNVLFLTCDLFGVLPPVAVLSQDQALYYFLSGYTALVGSTEMGSTADVSPTFSTCFGAPFFPRSAQVYADLLKQRLLETKAQVLLVNTGWYGGEYGASGSARYPINITRAIVNSALATKIQAADCWQFPGFEFLVPNSLSGVDAKWLDPRNSWNNPAEFNASSLKLRQAFVDNMLKMKVANDITLAGPKID